MEEDCENCKRLEETLEATEIDMNTAADERDEARERVKKLEELIQDWIHRIDAVSSDMRSAPVLRERGHGEPDRLASDYRLFRGSEVCDACQGTGHEALKPFGLQVRCSECQGTGKAPVNKMPACPKGGEKCATSMMAQVYEVCDACQGTGHEALKPFGLQVRCSECQGTGKAPVGDLQPVNRDKYGYVWLRLREAV